MKTATKAKTAILLMSTAIAGSVQAADTPPGFLADEPDVTYLGTMGDMRLFATPDNENVFAVSPDSTVIVEGRALTRAGRDIGETLRLDEAAGRETEVRTSERDASEDIDIASDPDEASMIGQEGRASMLRSSPSLPEMDHVDSEDDIDLTGIDIDDSDIQLTPAQPGREAQASGLIEDGQSDPDENRDAPLAALDDNIEDLPPDVQDVIQQEVLEALFEGLEAAQSPEDFVRFMTGWSAMVDNLYADDGAHAPTSMQDGVSAPTQDFLSDSGIDADQIVAYFESGGAARDAQPAQQGDAPAAGQGAQQQLSQSGAGGIASNPQGQVAPSQAGQPDVNAQQGAQAPQGNPIDQMGEIPIDTDLLRDDSFWFGVGAQDGPVAYAFIDPTCPFCARAMKALESVVEQGELGLRIIFTPILSESSGPTVAGILASNDPAEAFWRHSISYADFGNSDIRMQDPDQLPADFRQALGANVETMIGMGFGGVPTFVFDTPQGVQSFEGVPEPHVFRDAQPASN